MSEMIKEINAKTIINGKTVMIIGSMLENTGKLMNHNKKLAKFYNY